MSIGVEQSSATEMFVDGRWGRIIPPGGDYRYEEVEIHKVSCVSAHFCELTGYDMDSYPIFWTADGAVATRQSEDATILMWPAVIPVSCWYVRHCVVVGNSESATLTP